MIRDLRMKLWKQPHALAYVRCSKDEQEGSTAGQLRLIETEMKDRELSFVAPPFVDDGRRGSDETRPGLLSLMDYCRSHPVRIRTASDYLPIFVQSTDRLGRFLEPMKIFSYLNEFKELGYDIYSISEKIRFIGGNIGDWIQIVVRSDQATGYSVRLSHDSMRGGLQTAERGFLSGGSPCHGYDRAVVGADGKPRYRYTNLPGKRISKYTMDGVLVLTLEPILRKGKLVAPSLDKSNSDHVTRILGEPIKVKSIERLFELFIEERRGLRTVADTLNREGYPPPRGRKWYTSAVRSILTNPCYMGALVYGRRSKSKYHEFTVERSEGNGRISIDKKEIFRKGFLYREMEECIVVPDAHPAIIPKETWYRAQEILASKVAPGTPKRTGRGARSNYLLTGLAKCAKCGHNYQGDTHRRTGWRSYQCGGYAAGGKSVCQRATVPADLIERWVREEMQKRLLDGRARLFDDYRDFERAIEVEVSSQFRTERPADKGLKMIESTIGEKRKKLDLILTGLSADNMDVANDLIRNLKREISGLEEQLRRKKELDRPRLALNPKAIAKEAAGYVWNLKEVLDQGSTEEQRRFIEYFVREVKIDGKGGWVEGAFFDQPSLPGVTFCMVPPTGLTPYGKTRLPITYQVRDFPQPPVHSKRGRPPSKS
jgi:DNA invertase Pin-like site-specific DNA recombinase